MSKHVVGSIKKALELIRSGKMDAARPILLEILKKDENIEQAWFLLSYTLPPGEKQEYALNQALKINPEFDRARDRLETMQVQQGGIQPEDSLLESDESSELDEIESSNSQSNETELDEKSSPEPLLNKEEDKDPLNSFPEETFIVDVDENSDEESETKRSPKKIWAYAGLFIVLLVIVFLIASPGILSNLLGFESAIGQPTLVQGFRTLPPTWTP
jgi:hypothetical protein